MHAPGPWQDQEMDHFSQASWIPAFLHFQASLPRSRVARGPPQLPPLVGPSEIVFFMSMRQFIFQPAIVAYKWIKNLIVHGIIVGVLKKN